MHAPYNRLIMVYGYCKYMFISLYMKYWYVRKTHMHPNSNSTSIQSGIIYRMNNSGCETHNPGTSKILGYMFNSEEIQKINLPLPMLQNKAHRLCPIQITSCPRLIRQKSQLL